MNLDYKSIFEFIKFCFVGVLNTIITLSIIFILMKIFRVNYIISNVIGYIAGLINSFIWNKLWTFNSKGDFKRELVLFLIVYGIVYVMQLVFLIFIKEIIKVPVDIAQIIGMVFYTIVGFIGNKFITFNKKWSS